MFVNFINLKFKNLLSYGSNMTEIKFNSGLNQIVGMNGQGKSSILDALSFCLFGQTYRKIKLNELINTKNKKKLYTEVSFSIEDTVFRIVRGLKPDILEIYKNDTLMDSLSSKRLIQEEIDSILSINFNLFKEVICLAINYNKPFLLMPKNDKRNLIENIFQIGIISKMLTEVKNTHKGNEVDYKINKSSVISAKAEVENLTSYVENLEEVKLNFDNNKEDVRSSLELKINECDTQIEKCKSSRIKGNELLKDITLVGRDRLLGEKASIMSDIERCRNEIVKCNKEISLLNDNSTCPFCHSPLDYEHKDSHTNIITEKIDELNDKIVSSSTKVKEVDLSINEETIRENKIDKINKTLYRIDYDEKMKSEELLKLQNEYDENLSKEFDIDVVEYKNKLETKKLEYSNLENIGKDLLDKIELNLKVIEVLSDNGIKAYFYKKFLPNLNLKVNEYLNLFSLPVNLKFDDTMVEVITNAINKRPISYTSFSAGEQKRIDISIMFSLIQIMKDIANWRCNILFLDEVLDSSTDNNGLVKILESLNNLIYNNKNLCIYVISHRMHNEDIFTNKIKIEKENGFSMIKTEV